MAGQALEELQRIWPNLVCAFLLVCLHTSAPLFFRSLIMGALCAQSGLALLAILGEVLLEMLMVLITTSSALIAASGTTA
jgi:hypothetical protein